MSVLPVRVSNVLRVRDDLLDEESRRMLWSALTVVNPDDSDERVSLARSAKAKDGVEYLIMPRGFALRLKYGLEGRGYKIEWLDERTRSSTRNSPDRLPADFTPRHYQTRAVDRLVQALQGLVVAPTGSGKTFLTGMFVIKTQQRTCVITDKVNLATQWIRQMEDLGIDASYVGDQVWHDHGDVVVALRQSLWARRHDLDDADWWSQFGTLAVDEVQAVSGNSLREIIDKFPAFYRLGLSATPDRHEWLEAVVRAVIGEVVCRITPDELENAGVLVRPRVVAVKTPLEFEWSSRGDTRRQWHKLVKAVKTDRRRNRLIGEILGSMRGRCVLVQTDHLDHVDEIAAQALAHGWPRDSVMLMTGKVTGEKRDEVIARAADGDCVVVTTIGKEGLDIPRLDTYLMAWPGKSNMQTIQQLGRVRRVHDEKTESPIVIDLYDASVGPCAKQFQARRGVYEREKLKVSIIDHSDDWRALLK